jgi:excinuclease ABC subunit C
MDERIERLNEKAKTLPRAPGVYLMKDAKDRVIYVGKASSLRDRVGSYFQAATKLEFLKSGLRDDVVDFDFLQTDDDVEALLVENRLIKDIQPKYNARLTDDKTFPYLMITTGEEFPGVYITREPKTKGAKLYGPFTSVHQLREAVSLMQKASKFRNCHLEISESDPKRRFFRPCILHAIKQCTAPCATRINKEQYREDVNRFIRFLEGDKKQVLAQMDKEMIQASKDFQFERAARLRDEIRALQGLGKRAGKGEEKFWQPEVFAMNPGEGVAALQETLGMTDPPTIIEGIDIAHLHGGELVGSKVCFIDGRPFKDGYRRYKIRHGQGNNDFLSIQEVVERGYREAGANNELFPQLIMIDCGVGQLNAAMDIFKTMPNKPPMVVSLAKKEEIIYVQGRDEPIKLGRNHKGLRLLQYVRDEAHRFAQHYHHILRRKAQLEKDVKQGRRPPRKKKPPPSAKVTPPQIDAALPEGVTVQFPPPPPDVPKGNE